jgi:hypothetical protein
MAVLFGDNNTDSELADVFACMNTGKNKLDCT